MVEIIKIDKLYMVKWTLKTSPNANVTQSSKSFEIQDRKCTLLFHSGARVNDIKYMPLGLSIDMDEKRKFEPSVNITALVSSPSKMFYPRKAVISGEKKEGIWSSLDFSLRGSWLTFRIVVHDMHLKVDKSVQTTSSCRNTCILLEDTSKDFANLFEGGLDHDVEFICGDETIRAHKNILCYRSKIFASMLRSDMQEGKTCRVKIQDMESGIFRQFLKCLYTGVLPALTVDIALRFYDASHKYAVDTLKKHCANFLRENASPENACDILLLTDRHSDLDFKKNLIEYMIKVEEPITGDKWTDFCKRNPVLANEVLNLYCKHLRQKKAF